MKGLGMSDTRYLYNKRYYVKSRRNQTRLARLDKIVERVMEENPKKVLDVGCGIGYLVEKLRERGVEAYGTDFSTALPHYWGDSPYFKVADAKEQPFGDKEFDIVVSTDVLEHIFKQDVPKVAEELKRVGKKVIIYVAAYKNLSKRQLLFHVTNEPIEWWVENLPGIEVHNSRIFDKK